MAKKKSSRNEEALQRAQDGFSEIGALAAGIAMLIDAGDDGSAYSLANQIAAKAEMLVEVTDSVAIARLAEAATEGGAA
ncbi:MAG TPA: hypothetical protein VMV91_09470 [Rhodocyclaceae bacterium]|nr:hypothetical protein [Rhodocyclaceae bacterium]HUX24255.1 hypothetical protein [Burkholderiales bacterium]